PSVLKIRPHRDPLGRVVRPAVVALMAMSRGWNVPLPADAVLMLDSDPPSDVTPGDVVEFDDVRGKTRRLSVLVHEGAVVVGELRRTAYVVPATVCRFKSATGATTRRVVSVPPREEKLLLKKGDTLLLTRESTAGRPAIRDDHDRLLIPASIGIT